jgi:predicted DNA-binding protein (UPF0251 family)
MLIFSLRDAAKHAGTSKSTIWRAIRAGRLSAGRTDFGGFVIDPAELLRLYPQKTALVAAGHSTGLDGPERDTGQPAIKMAIMETELQALRAMVDELRQSRDAWRLQAERATAGLVGARVDR